MQPHDVFNRAFDATTTQLDQWLTLVAADADIEHERTANYWRVRLRPHQPGACPVELMLSRSQSYDLDAGSESVVAQPLTDLNLFQPLLQAVADGHLVHRTWAAQATGRVLTHELIVHLADGRDWRTRRIVHAGTAATELDAIARDRSYVAYRRD